MGKKQSQVDGRGAIKRQAKMGGDPCIEDLKTTIGRGKPIWLGHAGRTVVELCPSGVHRVALCGWR